MSPRLTASRRRAPIPVEPRYIAALATLTLLGALTASCRDATGPRLRVSVTLSSLQGPTYSADSIGRQLLRCDIGLQARATGSGWATWLDATFTFYAPNDSTTALATDTLSAGTVRSSWGADSIGSTGQSAHWGLTASVPFTLKARFRYQVGRGFPDSTGVEVSCEPNTRSSGTPPTITTLTNQSPAELEPGDTLTLAYAVSSQIGLWESIVRLTGPCDTTAMFPEQVQFSVSRTVSIVMPAGCGLGIPISVTAVAIDARLQTTSQALTLPALVDHTPPVLKAIMRTPYSAWAPAASFAGYLFTGDSITLYVTATDNHALHGIYWEVWPAGFRDSMLVSGPAAYPSVTIPAQAGWAGLIQLRLYAKDQSGNVSDTIASAVGAIQVAPTVGPAPSLTSIPGDITDMAFDAKRGVIYLLQSNSYRIAVFSPATLSVVRTIALTDYCPDFDLSPSGDSIITVLKNAAMLGVVDLTQASPALQTVRMSGLDTTYHLLNVRVAANGKAPITTQAWTLAGAGAKRVYTYDLASGTASLRSEVADLGYEASGQLERSTDGSVVVVNGDAGTFQRYDAATDRFEPGQTARFQDTRPSIDGTGAHVAVSGDLYNASLQYVLTVRADQRLPAPAALSSDGQTHYLAIAPTYTQLGIVRSRVSDGSIIDHIPAPLPITLLRASPDGSALAVAGCGYGTCSIGLVNLLQLH